MRSTVHRLAAAGVAAALSGIPNTGALRAQQQQVSIEEAIARQEASVAEMRKVLRAQPENADGWRFLITQEGMLAMMRRNAATRPESQDHQRAEGENRAVVARILAEWKAVRPGDAAPFLAEADFTKQQGEERETYLLELVQRFPDQPAAVGAAAEVLRRRGDHQAAGELVEGLLARHPDRADAYELVVRHHTRQGGGARGRAALGEWMNRFPEDLRALRAWLDGAESQGDPDFARPSIERLATSPPENTQVIGLCEALVRALRGHYREEGLGCLRKLAARPDEALRRQAAEPLVRAAALARDQELLEWALDRLPAAERPRALFGAASTLLGEAGETCDARIALAERARASSQDLKAVASQIAGATRYCEGRPRARALMLEIFTDGDPESVRSAFMGWAMRVNGVLRTELPVTAIIPVLERRLEQQSAANELWDVLDQLYEIEWSEKRLPHLRRWIAASPTGMGSDPYRRIIPLLLAEGGAEAAATLLESATEDVRGDSRLREELLGVYLLTGQSDKAKALAAAALAAAREQPGQASSAHLLLARAEWASGNAAGAEEHYRAVLSGESYFPSIAEEYLQLLGTSGKAGRVIAAAEELCRRPDARGNDGGAEECVAAHLQKLDLAAEAVTYLEEAIKRAPDNARLTERLAYTAEQAEKWEVAEGAWRRLLELDPANRNYWQNVGASEYRRGRREALESLVAASQREFGAKLPGLLMLLGKLYRDQGDPRRSIEALQELKRLDPTYYMLDHELRQSYAALARKEG